MKRFDRGKGFMESTLGQPLSLTAYFLVQRCLPVALVLVTVAMTVAVGHCFQRHVTSLSTRYLHRVADDGDNVQQPAVEEAPLLSPAELRVLPHDRGHVIHRGRPCVDDILVDMLSEVETHHMFVAASGPSTLVEGVRHSVVAAKHRGGRLEFQGSSPHW